MDSQELLSSVDGPILGLLSAEKAVRGKQSSATALLFWAQVPRPKLLKFILTS